MLISIFDSYSKQQSNKVVPYSRRQLLRFNAIIVICPESRAVIEKIHFNIFVEMFLSQIYASETEYCNRNRSALTA